MASRKAGTTKGSRWPGLSFHQASWPPLLFINRELGPFKELRLQISAQAQTAQVRLVRNGSEVFLSILPSSPPRVKSH